MQSGAKFDYMQVQTFAIVGLGLLGGSLGSALQNAFPKSKVLGYSRSASKIKLAKRKGHIHWGSTQFQKVVSLADVVVVCTPVDTIPSIVKQIDSCAKTGVVVTDVGSTKESIVNWASRQSFKNISFIGSHPMAGSHLTGLEHSREDLYRRAIVFVTRHPGMNQNSFRTVKKIWLKLQCRIVEVDPKKHDQIAGEISQFPHLVSALLVNVASHSSLKFASTGFRDTTRIAQGDPHLWAPIFMTNRASILRLIKKTEREFKGLKNALDQKNANFLFKFLEKAAKSRFKINQK